MSSTAPSVAPTLDAKAAPEETNVVPNGVTPHENGGQFRLFRSATSQYWAMLGQSEGRGRTGMLDSGILGFFFLEASGRNTATLDSPGGAEYHRIIPRDMENDCSVALELDGAAGESRTKSWRSKSCSEARLDDVTTGWDRWDNSASDGIGRRTPGDSSKDAFILPTEQTPQSRQSRAQDQITDTPPYPQLSPTLLRHTTATSTPLLRRQSPTSLPSRFRA